MIRTRLRSATATRPAAGSARRPHILLIVENVPLARDHRLQKQAATLAASGYRVSVICRADPANRQYAPARLHEYRAPADATSKLGFIREYGYSWLLAAFLSVRVFVSEPFDAVQVSGTPDIYFAIGAPFKLLGSRLVLDQRDLSPELYQIRYGLHRGMVFRMLCWLERESYRAADHVITVNRTLEDVAYARGGLRQGKVSVVGNGPVLAHLRVTPARPELKQGRRYLCCWVGFMGPQDRVDVALRMVDHLVHVMGRTDCHFAFLGAGEARVACEQLAAELGVEDWVTFTGWVGQETVSTYLSSADLGLEPNLEEIVSPVKGMEYMAYGLPFVSFDLRETRAVAGDAAAYAVCRDVAGLARLVDRLLDDPALRAEMGRLGRQGVAQRLAWERQESAYLKVYQRLLGGPLRGDAAQRDRAAVGRDSDRSIVSLAHQPGQTSAAHARVRAPVALPPFARRKSRPKP
jgi:glycosyltransferase involved in cell wall biosynthesis